VQQAGAACFLPQSFFFMLSKGAKEKPCGLQVICESAADEVLLLAAPKESYAPLERKEEAPAGRHVCSSMFNMQVKKRRRCDMFSRNRDNYQELRHINMDKYV
jgi:hypothetical protein